MECKNDKQKCKLFYMCFWIATIILTAIQKMLGFFWLRVHCMLGDGQRYLIIQINGRRYKPF